MVKCPDITSKEWKYAESKLGVDYSTLLYVYDFLGQREPSVKETNRLNKGESLTPYYNQSVWDVEVEEHLTKGRRAVVRQDRYGIEETVFEEVRDEIKQPIEASDRVKQLNKKYDGRFEFEMRPTKNNQAFNIFVKDLSVGLREDSNGELQIDQSPKKPEPVIEAREGNQYVREGIVYPTYEDAINAPQDHHISIPIKEGVKGVFRDSLELSSIGTQEQYSKYLDTIFPDSSVSNIVYHFSPNKFDRFDKQYFGTTSQYKDLKEFYFFTDKSDIDFFTTDNEGNTREGYVISAKVNNPQKKKWVGYPPQYKTESNFTEVAVNEPDQIHVLGSVKDIEGFKKFVQNDHEIFTQELFDRNLYERIKARLLKTLPYVENIVEDPSLPVSGRLMPGGTEIRINPLKVANDTLGHEFGHILIDLVGGMQNSLISTGREQLRDTPVEKEVIELYPELVGLEDDRLDKEIIARALGKKVTELFEDEEKRTKFENWMVRFYRKIRNALGIEISVVQRLAETMLNSKPLAVKEAATSKELKSGIYIQRELGFTYYQDSKADQEDGRIVQGLIKKEEEQRKKALAAIETKIGLYSKRSSGQQGEKAIETLKALQKNLEKSSPTRALIYFMKNAIKTTKDISDLYASALREERKGNPNAFTQRMLDEWRTYLSAYDVLEQYKNMLAETNVQLGLFSSDADKKALNLILGENRELLKSIEGLSLEGKSSFIDALMPVLDKVITQKNLLKKLYETKGKELTINFLLPYVTIIETDYREEAWRKYPTLSEADKAGRSREQYIEDYISDNRDEITKNTRLLLEKEIETGNDDMSVIYRYVDTVLDSPDIIASTLAKIWVTHMDENRKEVDEVRYNFVDRLKALEKQQGRNVTTSDEDFYSFMLERDPSMENMLTQYLVSAVPSKLDKDWQDYKETTMEPNFRVGSDNHIASGKERVEAREAWLDRWAPLDKEARYKSEHDFMLSLLKDKKITQKQMARWINNWKVTNYRAKLKDEDIFDNNPEIVLELKIFRRKHFWDNRKLSKFYDDLNGQWRTLEKLRADNPNDERIKFYDFIVDSMEKSDNLLPYKKRLGYRLPGMTRGFADRLRAGEPVGMAIKRSTGIGLQKQSSDVDKGTVDERGRSELVNEAKETVYLIPTNYLNEVDLKDQFFDVGSLYFGFQRMAMNYRATADILPQLEMGKYFVENRDVTRRDAHGKPFTDALSAKRDRILTKSGKNSMIAAQLDDFFKMNIFGQTKAEEPDLPLWNIDRAKLLDGINKYTSLSLLGLNMVAGTANVLYGETLQGIDAWGGENFTTKNLAKATGRYYKDLGNVLADVGERAPHSLIGLLNDRFDTLNEYNGGRLNKNSRFRWLMQTSTMFFISHAGEHYMQTRAMMAMLDNLEAKDGDGKVIGSMLDMYSVDKETGRLKIDERVKNWDAAKETLFKNKLKRVLARLHGEYSQEGRSAIQKTALGRMALLFRKFMVPGFKRRWQKRQYNNLSESYTEGNYITFGKFFTRLIKDMVSLKFELLSSTSPLTKLEQANIKRTLGEVTFLIAAIIMGRFALKMKEDDPENERIWSFMAYQAFRLRSELSFYVVPSSTMQILRSPMASMSALESTLKLASQLADPLLSGTFAFDTYDRGPWKGSPKIYKTLTNMTPGFKQYFRVRDIADQLSWFQNASIQMK